jgi:hypothetical protein
MTTTTSAGTTWHFSAGVPAAQTEAGFSALAYTKVGGVESLGPIGPTTGVVSFVPLSGPTEKHKGATNYGTLNPPMAYDGDDAGQILVRTAAEPENNALYANKVIYPTGEVRYFQARVFGFPENVGGREAMLMANPIVEICTKPIRVDAP